MQFSKRFSPVGLPYAVRQAGFFTGIILLVLLCAVTDWTIRLIVINAKLSGSHSYIEIMDHCFGSSGRAAVSFFQFAFAFGGWFLSKSKNSDSTTVFLFLQACVRSALL